MSGMAALQALICPFCNFEDVEAAFLLQHINLLHPESEDAPYIVKNEQEQPHASQLMEGAHDWIECECGEFCLLSQFQDHFDLHRTEDADIDSIDIPTDVAASATASAVEFSSSMQPPDYSILRETPYIIDPYRFSESLIMRSAPYASTHSHGTIPPTHQIARPSGALPTKKIATKERNPQPMRLGVSSASLRNISTLIQVFSGPSLGPTIMKPKCLTG